MPMHEGAAVLQGRLVTFARPGSPSGPAPGEEGAESAVPEARGFEERLAESATLAFRVAYGVLRSREDAEDVAQEAAIRAYQGFASLRNKERFRPWLVRIAWRLALDRRRSERRRESRESAVTDTPPPSPSVEDLASARQAEERVWKALDAL